MSAPTPPLTRLPADVADTFAIVLSAFVILKDNVSWLSAKTVTPAYESGLYPVFSIDTVYVSGASERKLKRPEPSVVAVAVCDAETALTAAPATGAPASSVT